MASGLDPEPVKLTELAETPQQVLASARAADPDNTYCDNPHSE